MSKNKKHKNTNYQNNKENDVMTDETTLDTTEVFDEETITTTGEEVVTDEDIISNDTVLNDVEKIIAPSITEVENTDVVIAPPILNFYKVGTNYINNKCINQITYTTDLDIAKTECDKARDSYNKTYHVFDKMGNDVYTAEYNIPKDNYYRVGTEWKNGRCINQKYYCVNLDDACKKANENTKTTGVIHNVYNPTGKVVFSSKKKLTLLSKKREVNRNADWYTK